MRRHASLPFQIALVLANNRLEASSSHKSPGVPSPTPR